MYWQYRVSNPFVFRVCLLFVVSSCFDTGLYFFPHPSNFQLLDKPRYPPFSVPVVALNFYLAQGSEIPLLVDFSSSGANTRFRDFRKSICGQEEVPTNIYEYALGGARTHETDLLPGSSTTEYAPGATGY